MVLDTADFQTLTDSALKTFDERVAAVHGDSRQSFELEATRLESQVFQLYGVAALLARREMDLDKVAEIWGDMVAACDAAASKIQTLRAEHLSGSASHDTILDIRNKAAELRDIHL